MEDELHQHWAFCQHNVFLPMMENLFGEQYEDAPRKPQPKADKAKRRWEDRFQKWSNAQGMDGYTHYGCCGFGQICNYCENNHIGRPCVRALNEMCRAKKKTLDYATTTYEEAFDGEF